MNQGSQVALSSQVTLSPIIKNIMPGLVERGKIKIGHKGRWNTAKTFQMPEKLDHFLITKLSRDKDTNNFELDDQLMGKLMDQQDVESIKEIPIKLLYNDISLNFQCQFNCYHGRTRWCRGDGEQAIRMRGEKSKESDVIACPCERVSQEFTGQDKCKPNGCLSCIIVGAEAVGGVWKLRTTSWNSVVGILSSLTLIKSLTGGPLAGIPLVMTLNPKSAQKPEGGSVVIYVVGIEYRGTTEKLQDVGYQIAFKNEQHYARIEHIETEARKLLSVEAATVDNDDVAEFYPEQEQVAGAPQLVGPGESKAEAPAEVAPIAPATPTVAPTAAPAAEPPKRRVRRTAAEIAAASATPATAETAASPTPPTAEPAKPVEPTEPPLEIPDGIENLGFDI